MKPLLRPTSTKGKIMSNQSQLDRIEDLLRRIDDKVTYARNQGT